MHSETGEELLHIECGINCSNTHLREGDLVCVETAASPLFWRMTSDERSCAVFGCDKEFGFAKDDQNVERPSKGMAVAICQACDSVREACTVGLCREHTLIWKRHKLTESSSDRGGGGRSTKRARKANTRYTKG